MSYRLVPRAEVDLAAAIDYITPESPRAASRMLVAVERACGLLGDNPYLGRARPELGRDTRSWVVGRYLILYRPVEGGIEVVRVVHGARDLDAIEG